MSNFANNLFLRRLACSLLVITVLLSACGSPATPAPVVPAEPNATDTPAPTLAPEVPPAQEGALAPEGVPNQVYYAPFPVGITLDGDLSDWQGVPTVNMASAAGDRQVKIRFAAAADDQNFYFMADVTKATIVAGMHENNFWNEDSVECYLNATGDLGLGSYFDGVAQVTVPAFDIGKTGDQVVNTGVNGDKVGAKPVVVKTDKGYALELALPLKNNFWDLTPAEGRTLGFQVHLNGASTTDRDTKLIWSAADTNDSSYQNPGVFGQLIYVPAGSTEKLTAQMTATPLPPTPMPDVPSYALYLKADAPLEERVTDLLGRMSLEEKIGQMTLAEKNALTLADTTNMYIGGALSGGGGNPVTNTPTAWTSMVTQFQRAAMKTRLAIPIIYGVDAIHGHNNVKGATIFPHNIGLGAANDPALMEKIGQVTASELIGTGVRWDFAPVVAVTRDIRWGRTYESYSEDTNLVTSLAVAYLKGLQGSSLSDPLSAAGTLKHYVGDGGTAWGSSTTSNYKLDQGVTQVDEATLRAVHLAPYISGLEAGARIVMVSYSSFGGMKMHAQKYLITDVLKGELGFTGFVVSDWGGIDQISTNYYDAVVAGINAGIDMNMVPSNYKRFLTTLKKAIENGDISQERIDEAVRRILRVKFEIGLFEHPYADPEQAARIGSAEHRALAAQAVSESLVLLKNDNNALPLSKTAKTLFVAGAAADDIGIQTGGWTITWQGGVGVTTKGTTILQGIRAAAGSGTTVTFDAAGNFPGSDKADACVVAVGELPYAEGIGDKADLSLSAADSKLTQDMRARCEKLVVLLVAGRPMIVTDELPGWDAFVAAWLPGTEGQGVSAVLFGDQPFTGKLPFTWPRSNEQLPFDFANLPGGENGPLFPFGYGLTK
jgi:beta-glucosidase